MPPRREVWTPAPGLSISEAAMAEFVRVCVKNSEYEFVSGGHGTSYVDLDELFGPNDADQERLREFVSGIVAKIRELISEEDYGLLAFVDGRRGPTGAVGLRTLLAQELGVDSVIVRPYKRLISQAIKPFRIFDNNDRILIVTDVATTGRSIVEAAETLWRAGAQGLGALTVAHRRIGAPEYLTTMDIPLHFVVQPDPEPAA